MTYKKGISALSAPSPAPWTADKMQIAPAAMTAEASAAGRTMRFISRPASIRTGAARKAFMNAYRNPLP
ncbi:MAG: hypothetical protein K2N84_02210 [Clostridia bacterium]|nr:hypothetical protein [Clostridia bacterium]